MAIERENELAGQAKQAAQATEIAQAEAAAPSSQVSQLEERALSSEIVFEGQIFNVERLQVELPNGKQASRDIVQHNGAVAIIALNDNGQILLVRQYRAPLKRVMLEIPAGRLETGEQPLQAAKRELSEETGFDAKDLRYIQPVAIAAGYSSEIIHIILATGLTAGMAHPDEDEFVSAEWMNIDEFCAAALEGKIEDSKTLIAALMIKALDLAE